jgi:hypothetical protein
LNSKNKNINDKYGVLWDDSNISLFINGKMKHWTQRSNYSKSDIFKMMKEAYCDSAVYLNYHEIVLRMSKLGEIQIDTNVLENLIYNIESDQNRRLNNSEIKYSKLVNKQNKINKLLQSPKRSSDSILGREVKEIEDQLQSFELWCIERGINLAELPSPEEKKSKINIPIVNLTKWNDLHLEIKNNEDIFEKINGRRKNELYNHAIFNFIRNGKDWKRFCELAENAKHDKSFIDGRRQHKSKIAKILENHYKLKNPFGRTSKKTGQFSINFKLSWDED